MDLLLLKKDVASHLLFQKMDTLTLAVDIKTIIRETVSTVDKYRSAMGEPHYDPKTATIVDGKPVDTVDLTWRGALGILGRMFLELLEAMVCKLAAAKYCWNGAVAICDLMVVGHYAACQLAVCVWLSRTWCSRPSSMARLRQPSRTASLQPTHWTMR
jgi:hypothetical protein